MPDILESTTASTKLTQFEAAKCRLHDTFSHDIDCLVKTLCSIKANGVKGDLVGSTILHYASKWLPELSEDSVEKDLTNMAESSVTASWMKKRFFVETVVGILPPEKDSVSCDFLLKLLRVANIVRVEPGSRAELERRISWQLDQATLKELMIPSFSHTCRTLLDVEMVLRLVQRFVDLSGEGIVSGAAMIKVAKLLDSYLAEAANDSNLMPTAFLAIAGVLPATARSTDDGLYRAVDTYLKAHPGVSKEERKSLCNLFDSRKLSLEASLHASQNGRLPIRVVIQAILLSRTKITHPFDWSGSFRNKESQSLELSPYACYSMRKRTAQQLDVMKLKEDIVWLERQSHSMQGQIERLLEKKKGPFSWKKWGVAIFRSPKCSSGRQGEEREIEGDKGFAR